jgi:hypothetical protein
MTPNLPVPVALLKSRLVRALRRLNSLFYQGTILGERASLAGQFW